MPSLAEFYSELLQREGNPPQCLVDPWTDALIQSVEDDFRAAVSASGIKTSICPIRPNSTNQSIGNQIEKFAIPLLKPCTSLFSLEDCRGPGYPDRMIVIKSTNQKIPLEIKATSCWNPKDSNRRVLSSSSRKLRKFFQNPICHLLGTILYTVIGNGAQIDAVRLDFIEPETIVNIRLEAEVNHRLLSEGQHRSITI